MKVGLNEGHPRVRSDFLSWWNPLEHPRKSQA
jgi:hypothetical protein